MFDDDDDYLDDEDYDYCQHTGEYPYADSDFHSVPDSRHQSPLEQGTHSDFWFFNWLMGDPGENRDPRGLGHDPGCGCLGIAIIVICLIALFIFYL